ncbi:MAG: hypothetical protein ACFWUC_04545 [Oscillospiraceae bacterium]|jgi:hypothetical protein
MLKKFFSPKTVLECFSVVLTLLGIIYCVISFPLYCLKKEIGFTFLLIGLGFLFLALLLWIPAWIHHRKNDSLLNSGLFVRGKVHKVRQYRYISFSYKALRKRHPWRFWYEYEYGGKTYLGRSNLLWQKPDLHVGDPITVWVDLNRPGTSCPDTVSCKS